MDAKDAYKIMKKIRILIREAIFQIPVHVKQYELFCCLPSPY